ncbi:ABC transporter permease [Spirosoma fluviale]|uniref:ABC-type antimicrobial peptide transport system, permease component n=1 Tax=Spirosoma fluviale TaxID=1597977 RepID=A0A286G2B1_9BACT|nr:ABC transporter permease [Spirosoma fluviale]SOD89124.1 ABC-type antimicrobial peptide transport system, permease component [Spirosoma fluviale]
MKSNPTPPRWVHWLLRQLHPENTLEEVAGDLDELYAHWHTRAGKTQATLRYVLNVVSVLPPFVRRRKQAKQQYEHYSPLHPAMIRNYLKIAWRNLTKNKIYSFINISGLATGMAVTIMIGLWVYDELSFDRQTKHYDRIAQLWQFVTFDVEKTSYNSLPIPLAQELRSKYPDFDLVSLASFDRTAVLASGENRFTKTGNYVESDFLPMMSVKMLVGTYRGLTDVNSILLSASTAKTLFGTADPLNKLIKLDNKVNVRVTGIYEDFPQNSSFKATLFLAPWRLLMAINENAKGQQDQWDSNGFPIYVQLKNGVSADQASARIKDIRMKRENPPPYKPEFFLHPMAKWHLYSDFKNGVNTGGLIQFVWLFGIIGVFVLLLACINFMNLSTARSEKRAKEVGIRKAVGSLRGQLISQFFAESLLVTGLAFVLALVLVQLSLPLFNTIADKHVQILWFSPIFWLIGLGFTLLTGLIAASYPALYLSSFQPIKVLKGTIRMGRLAAIPRKVLVVFQFAVSITLIIGTIIVLRQIEFAKDRPVGYSRNRLIEVRINTPELVGRYNPLRTDLLNTGAVANMSESDKSLTADYGGTTDISWPGKTPDMHPLIISNLVTHDFGKTIDWQLTAGRDFSRAYTTDSSAMILNESALKLMGLTRPLGTLIKQSGREYRVIGIVKDIINGNPFEAIQPSFFVIDYRNVNIITLKLAPQVATSQALEKVAEVFKQYNPAAPFEYTFVDDEYGKKFGKETRIGNLAMIFAAFAIFISCLGIFGLASFIAEQRTKEIGVRKVLGASVMNLWGLLSRDFIVLVLISIGIATPIAWYLLNNWLQHYTYRTTIAWWVFALTGAGTLLLTLLTVSFQSVRAALTDPVKSLRSE